MKLKDKVWRILLNSLPIILMISLIYFTQNDFLLTGIYILIIAVSLIIRYEKTDSLFLIFGFIAMTIAEYIFVSIGVETFARDSLFGVMPLWLPLLWAYAFVVMKRAIEIINKDSKWFRILMARVFKF